MQHNRTAFEVSLGVIRDRYQQIEDPDDKKDFLELLGIAVSGDDEELSGSIAGLNEIIEDPPMQVVKMELD